MPNWARTGRERDKKKIIPDTVSLAPSWSVPKKIVRKFKKIKKNITLALFLAKPGWHRPRKRENFRCPKFSSCPTRARVFQKKK